MRVEYICPLQLILTVPHMTKLVEILCLSTKLGKFTKLSVSERASVVRANVWWSVASENMFKCIISVGAVTRIWLSDRSIVDSRQ